MFPDLKCIKCSEQGCIMLHLDDCQNFRCREYEEDFTVDEIQEHLEQWRRVLEWTSQAVQVES